MIFHFRRFFPWPRKRGFIASQHGPLSENIVKRVAAREKINHQDISHGEIFRAIFDDLEQAHLDPEYQSKLKVPSINCTIVLVPGALNEVFTTPAFSRGAHHLSQKFNFKVFSPQVIGTKSSWHNQELLGEQLHQYIEQNPEEKLWMFCFSKGGLDTFHFLKENPDFARKHIVGVSLVATPILGSDNMNHQALKILNKIHNYQDHFIYKFLDKKFDLFLKDFQKSLNIDYQSDWFEKNHSSLPQDIFYTAMAFEIEWYKSHPWMIFAKGLLQSKSPNDGVVDIQNALFPDYFQGINLGIFKGHHLVGTEDGRYCQEALLEAHVIFLSYMGLIREAAL